MPENTTSLDNLEQPVECFQQELFVQKLILLHIKLCELKYELKKENDKKIKEIDASALTSEQKETEAIKNLESMREQLKPFEEMIIEHIVKAYIDSNGEVFNLPEFDPDFDGRYIDFDIDMTSAELREEVEERVRIIMRSGENPFKNKIYFSLEELMKNFDK